jgi:hypothetical protein
MSSAEINRSRGGVVCGANRIEYCLVQNELTNLYTNPKDRYIKKI